MKKIISITAALICTIFLQNSVIAQEAPKNPANKDLKPIKEESICKEVKKPNFMKFQPPAKMPRKLANTIELFKFADEIKLTDEQIIKLRAFYKKHYSEKTPKKDLKPIPNPMDFYKMSDEELVKFADDAAANTKNMIMSKLQKIIDIRKILTQEQFELIKKEIEKDAEINKKLIEKKKAKKANKRKRGFFPPFPMYQQPPMGCPQMGMMPPMGPMPHQPGMMPHNNMPPMGCPQMGMMPPMGPMPQQPGMMPHNNMPPMGGPQMGMMPPMGPMPHQPGMMPHHNMPPMGGPQMGMMPPMGPMPQQPGMMPHNNMPPMGCPQMGMMPPMGHQPNFGPMPKFDKPGKDKKPGHKFEKKNCSPMMNPMGFNPGYMPQPNMMGCCPCQMRPSMRPPRFGFNDNQKERKPPFDFLMKLFSCKKDKDSDIILKDKEIKNEKSDKNQPNVPLKH